ncbi:assimilatory sulfite reductase (NADPH) flavoprotein subunit [Aliikangiella coralliicola]|uniref:assimilatory sulfite reductase (NADPH) flavoprotein subunit n=1 Tax=Aliikangiella coralliicola TaxID=2592383 RepID=UPI00143DC7A7|nr:assimilatory sulfite reductase (NADPH) flavoprotein subunit [Aliikangiella coralliicola]
MNKKVDLPHNALPLNPDLLETVQKFDSKELYWLSGYCSGLADAKHTGVESSILPTAAAVSQAPVALKTVVLYASQSGNAQDLAELLHQNLGQKGIDAELASVADFKSNKLKEQQVILMIASTHGEGEPPDDAIDFHEYVLGKRAPKLEGVRHAVLSLGDSSYEFFCQTGKDFDQAFSKLGSQSLVERVDCDLDYDAPAAEWIAKVVDEVALLSDFAPTADVQNITTANPACEWTKANPFTATVLENQKITGRGSIKHINHLELSLEGSGINYLPGDSLGVWAKNNAEVVSEILTLTELTGDEQIALKEGTKTLVQALTENLEISLVNKEFVSQYAELTNSDALREIVAENYLNFIKNNQLVDVIRFSPKKLEAQQLVDLLKPIKPRMYSIASSLQAAPEEVHLTVGLQQSENDNGTRYGTASHFLIEALQEDDEVLVFVDENRHFKLPENDQPVIMIGPGTGIAPFRAFLQERQEISSSGENWLFFGNPNFNTDFLYQVELQNYLKDGLLTHLSVAFSRDQSEKVYVQHRLLENAESLWQWINEKQAYIYVCGDMSRMAKDVESALITIAKEQGGKSQEDAEVFIKALKKEKRYQRDVY